MTEKKSPTGTLKRRITDQDGDIYDERDLFNEYARFGGMPMLADVGLEIDRVTAALDGVYSAAVVNDILEREKRKGRRTITDPILLRKIIMFLADNVGNNVSATSIGNTLVNEGLLEEKAVGNLRCIPSRVILWRYWRHISSTKSNGSTLKAKSICEH